ncbi:lipoprotein insertase outer membrane protein LolB [Thermithiobacillus plumbiphilus]|uniref:Outer-membrane lipoprotein LolB n=1 Tax=Thermithiobacillus plumbiphilus TaxID=1729899 RepID=A0ABU9D7Q4_9PROT
MGSLEMFRRPATWPLLMLVLAMSGCASLPPEPLPAQTPAQRSQKLEQLQSWSAQGRVAVQAGNEGNSAAFEWQRTGGTEVLRMRDPLGRTVMLLEQSPQGAYAKFADGFEASGPDAATVLAGRSPMPLPVSSLAYWLRGQALPGQLAEVTYDSQGNPEILKQAGWTVTYQDYRPVNGVAMPGRVLAEGPQAVRVKAVIRDWQLQFGNAAASTAGGQGG